MLKAKLVPQRRGFMYVVVFLGRWFFFGPTPRHYHEPINQRNSKTHRQRMREEAYATKMERVVRRPKIQS